ncbi:MAG: AAA family ATPase, partial [Planctomycetota bacterium]
MSRQHVKTCLLGGLVPMLEGPPGSGKTAVLAALADELQWEFLPIVMSVMEPIDAMGLPTVQDGRAEFLAFGTFERVYAAKSPTLVLLDDLGQAA